MLRLHELVRGLSSDESKRFLAAYKSAKGKDGTPLYVTLFKALRRMKVVESKEVMAVVNTTSSTKLINLARYLENAIFESLALSLCGGRSGVNVCTVALDKGHFDYVEKTLYQEIARGLTTEDLQYLYGLYKIWERLRRQYRYELSPPEEIPAPIDFFREHARFVQAEQITREFKKNLNLTEKEKRRYARDFAPISRTISKPSECKFIRVKEVLYRVDYYRFRFRGDIEKATEKLGESFRIIREHQSLFPLFEALNIGNALVLLYKDSRKDILARTILEDICSLEVEDHLEDYQKVIWMSNTLHLALNLNDTNEGKRAIRELEDNEHLFPSFTKGYLYHLASLTHLSEENWNRAIYYQNRSSIALKRSKKLNGWTNYLVRALCYYEVGKFGEAKRNLKSIDYDSLAKGERYPLYLFNLLMDLIRYDQNVTLIKERLSTAHEEIEMLFQDETELFASIYFNILPWIESKIEGVEINEILSKDRTKRLMVTTIAS